MLPLPKSVTPERIEANAQLDFDLEAEDVEALDHLVELGRLSPVTDHNDCH